MKQKSDKEILDIIHNGSYFYALVGLQKAIKEGKKEEALKELELFLNTLGLEH